MARSLTSASGRLGFTVDHDHQVTEQLRFVQLTPPGSACSIAIGTGTTTGTPGSAQGVQLVVEDIEAARAELVARGVEVSDFDDQAWSSFIYITDPDGNGWTIQQPTPRASAAE